MILIITHKDDYTADFVIEKLNARRIPYFRFNCEECLNMDLSISYSESGPTVLIGGHYGFKSIWYRRTKLPIVQAGSREQQLYLVKEVDTFMHNLFGLIEGRWLSDPFFIEKAENKFLQLAIAKRVGFLVPKTVAGTNKMEIKYFLSSGDKIIVKPISSGRILSKDGTVKLIFSNLVSQDAVESFDDFDHTPAIFQEYIEKDFELRITIVGSKVFSAKVDSQADPASTIDWRRKRSRFERTDLPADIEGKCMQMMRELRIEFGAFDLIKDKVGNFWFLEVNPNGQWVWIERDTGMEISDAIIDFLS